jgi:hypothetical protein
VGRDLLGSFRSDFNQHRVLVGGRRVGRGRSCASKDTGSTQASASTDVAGGGVREVVDAASLVRCMGKTTRKHSGAKRWMEMASWASGDAELA